jgi:hypothetical protein
MGKKGKGGYTPGVQGRSGCAGGKERETNKPDRPGFGVNENMLRRWIQQAQEAAKGGLPPFPRHGRPRDEESVRLRKENNALREAV